MSSKQSIRRQRAKSRINTEMKRLIFDGQVTIEAAQDGDDAAGKRLPRLSIDAYNGGIMRPSGLWGNVVVDLSGIRVPDGSTPILLGHDHSQIVGHATVVVTDRAVLAEGVVSGAGQPAVEFVASARNGFPWRASIGLSVERSQYLDDDEEAVVNGQMISGATTIVRQSMLGEISVLPWAADSTTSVQVAAGKRRANAMDPKFDEWLAAQGFDGENLTEAQVALLAKTWKAESGSEPPAETPASDPVRQYRESAALETERIAAVRTICGGQYGEIEAAAIRGGWDATRVELEVLRAERQTAPAIHTGSSSEPVGATVLEAACAMNGGLQDAEKQFDPKTLEAAHRRFRHGIGMQELIMEAAWANGYQSRRFRGDMDGALRAAFSTKSLSGILSNTANKFLLEGFMYVESAWREISARRSVNDFKTVTSYRLTGDLQFIEVGPTGEIKHGEIDETSYTNQAKTYARMFSISRADIINDDLGALTAVPRRIGRGAALKLNDVFWTAFMDNSSFFTAGRGNYISGATTTLTAVGLTAGVLAFRKLVDSDGKPVGVTPKILLVPPDLEVAAEELFVSTNINTGGAATTEKVPNRNVFAAKYRPVVSYYLSNSGYTGYSVTAWYLLADPRDLATIEVAFLNGRETPVVESADADFNTLGIQMRGYFDFGASKSEYLGGVMSKGAA